MSKEAAAAKFLLAALGLGTVGTGAYFGAKALGDNAQSQLDAASQGTGEPPGSSGDGSGDDIEFAPYVNTQYQNVV